MLINVWYIPFIHFFSLLIILYFTSKNSLQSLYTIFSRYLPFRHLMYIFVAVLYLPGTFIHELSHFLMALILLLRVRHFSLFPEVQHDSIRLGHVIYERHDFIRGILVGIAPVFGGLLFFYALYAIHIFPSSSIGINIILGYLIYAVSSTMFSSKQDLLDFIYLLPVVAILGIIVFLFKIDIIALLQAISWSSLQFLTTYITNINIYLLFAVIIHCIIIAAVYIIKSIHA